MVLMDQTLRRFSYLAIVPRGLQDEIASNLQEHAKDCRNDDDNGNNDDDEDDDVLKITIWNEREDEETKREALKDLSIQLQENEKRRMNQKLIRKHQENKNNNNINKQQQQTQLEEKEKKSSLWFPPECSVGSVYSDGRHISVGYYSTNNNNNDDDDAINVTSSPSYASMWTWTGQLAGNVWMQLETNRKTISQEIIVPSRCLGSLLALITIQTDNQCLQATEAATTTNDRKNIDDDDNQHCIHRHHQNYQQHSLEDMTRKR
jgi:hypothetical protein